MKLELGMLELESGLLELESSRVRLEPTRVESRLVSSAEISKSAEPVESMLALLVLRLNKIIPESMDRLGLGLTECSGGSCSYSVTSKVGGVGGGLSMVTPNRELAKTIKLWYIRSLYSE